MERSKTDISILEKTCECDTEIKVRSVRKITLSVSRLLSLLCLFS